VSRCGILPNVEGNYTNRDQKMQKRIRGLHQGPAAHKFLQTTEKKDYRKLLQALKLPTISSDDVASYESDLDECDL
jgi:hypothetical protein